MLIALKGIHKLPSTDGQDRCSKHTLLACGHEEETWNLPSPRTDLPGRALRVSGAQSPQQSSGGSDRETVSLRLHRDLEAEQCSTLVPNCWSGASLCSIVVDLEVEQAAHCDLRTVRVSGKGLR